MASSFLCGISEELCEYTALPSYRYFSQQTEFNRNSLLLTDEYVVFLSLWRRDVCGLMSYKLQDDKFGDKLKRRCPKK